MHANTESWMRGPRKGGDEPSLPLLHAVVVTEPYAASCRSMQPLSPHPDLPFALLPICNTPLIDYILENLMDGNVDRITVLVRSNDHRIEDHLKDSSLTIRLWLRRKWLTIRPHLPPIGSASPPITFHSVIQTVVANNIVTQDGSFLVVPINSLAAFTDLRSFYRIHLERAGTISRYAATVLCCPAEHALSSALHNVLEWAYRKLPTVSAPHSNPPSPSSGHITPSNQMTAGSNGNSGSGGANDGSNAKEDDSNTENELRLRHHHLHGGGPGLLLSPPPPTEYTRRALPTHPKEHHTIIAYDSLTGVVSHMSRFEADPGVMSDGEEEDAADGTSGAVGGEASETQITGENCGKPAIIPFSKSAQCVRMDLIPTNYLFFCCSATALTESGADDVHSFLNDMLAKVEVLGNCFGLLEVPRSSGMMESITTPDSFLRANLDVCARRFFPLTREACFADPQLCYEVAPWCETVYLHIKSMVQGKDNIGPYAVFGPCAMLPQDVVLCCGVCCGANVEIGEGCSLVGCVILDGAKIGARCHLRYVMIGKDAVIEDDTSLASCLVEHGAHVSLHTCGHRAYWSPTGASPTSFSVSMPLGLVLERKVVRVPAVGRTSGSSSSSSSDDCDGEEAICQVLPLLRSNILPTEDLFVYDAIAAGDSESDGKDSEKKDACTGYAAIVDSAVLAYDGNALTISGRCMELTTNCGSHNVSYRTMLRMVTSRLMERFIMDTNAAESAEDIVEMAEDMFYRWLWGFYDGILTKQTGANLEDSMLGVLEGLCEAVNDEDCHLFASLPDLVEVLYSGCDPQMAEQRHYCIVDLAALSAFAENVVSESASEVEEEEEEEEDYYDENFGDDVMKLPATRKVCTHILREMIPRVRSRTNFGMDFGFNAGDDGW